MFDPDYIYQPWTPERRKAASEAARKRSLAKTEEKGLKGLLKQVRSQAFGAGYEEGLKAAKAHLHAMLDKHEAPKVKKKYKPRLPRPASDPDGTE